jgi:hypothetical protein
MKAVAVRQTPRGLHVQAKTLVPEGGYGGEVHLPLRLGKRLGGGTLIPVRVTIEDIPFYAVIREHSIQDEFEYWVWRPVRYEMYVYAPMHQRISMWVGMTLDLYFVRAEHKRSQRGYPVPKKLRRRAPRAGQGPTRARKP